MWKENGEMAMRPWGHAAALVLVLALARAGAATDTVPDRARDLPSAPEPQERPVLRGTDGSARGFGDGSVVRGTDGTARGLSLPDPGGSGATTRGSDGSFRGIQPGAVPVQRYQPFGTDR
jgi:hypothetical protein